jgi:hypothetical protein
MHFDGSRRGVGLGRLGRSSHPFSDPLTYPGRQSTDDGVVGPWGFRAIPAPAVVSSLQQAGAAPMTSRTPVIGVGSNASPAVLRTKLGATSLVPLEVVWLDGVVLAYSAHVSRWGYVPAAVGVDGRGSVSAVRQGLSAPEPPRARLRVTLGWFDEAQLALLDASEPNYTRVPVNLGGRSVWLYDTDRGVLADPRHGAVRPFASQHVILGWVATLLAVSVSPRSLATRLAADATLRAEVTSLLQDHRVPSGLPRPR